LKLSQIINYPLGLLGLKMIRKPVAGTEPLKDIEADKEFQAIYQKVKGFTLVGPERCYALYQSLKYILANDVSGDLVECGVWKGGSAMLMAYTLLGAGINSRRIFLYDTFEGMPKPGEKDGEFEKREWERLKLDEQRNNWCLSTVEEVKNNLGQTGYPKENIVWIKGKVEETIPGQLPSQIALLRLDTDWYESTKHELLHLFPLLENKGVLIIDDYGAWQGAKKATDEYFAAHGPVYLNRIDFTGRLLIK